MSQPERDYRAIDSCLQEFRRGRVAQTMWSHPFLIQRRAPLSGNSDMLCQQILHTVRAEPGSSGVRKDNLAVAPSGLLEPELQSTYCLLALPRQCTCAPVSSTPSSRRRPVISESRKPVLTATSRKVWSLRPAHVL